MESSSPSPQKPQNDVKVILCSPCAWGTSLERGKKKEWSVGKLGMFSSCVQINNGLGLTHRALAGGTERAAVLESYSSWHRVTITLPYHCSMDSKFKLSTKTCKKKSYGTQHKTCTSYFQERAMVNCQLTPALQPGEGLQPTEIPLNSCSRQGQSTWGFQLCQP